MKTLRIISNSLQKSILVVLATLLLSTGTFAQKSFRNNDIRLFTASLFKSSEDIMVAVKKSAEMRAFQEEEILLEDWMTDLDKWAKHMDTASQNSETTAKAVESESEMELMEENLELEDWMIDIHWIEKEVIEEEDMNLEAWMKNPGNWHLN